MDVRAGPRYNGPMKRWPALAILFTLSCGGPTAEDLAGPRPPNIILISIDTLRADRLGVHGYERATTPHIDAFAREAVRFSNAVSQAPTTAPAHMSIFTGLMPAVHRVSNIHAGPPQALDPGIPTLTELLRDAGYYTAGFHGGGNIDGSLGFERGFDFYSQDYVSYNWMGAYHDPADLDAIRAWLRIARGRGKPLFLFLHHYVCHSPYISAPEAFRDRFLAGRAVEGLPRGPGDAEKQRMAELLDRRTGGRAKRLLQWGMFRETHDRFWKGVDLGRVDHHAHITALYDAQVAYSDWLIGRVVRMLRQEKVYDDSLIVILSDHGEEFGEHGGREHEQLFVETLHVPLLIRFPDRAGIRPRAVERMVRTMDVMPSLFEHLDLAADFPHQGQSFLPLLGGQGSYDPPMVSYDDRDFHRVRLVRDGLVYTNQHNPMANEWLFDAAQDPAERSNLAAERPADLERMRRLADDQRRADIDFLSTLRGSRREPRIDPALLEQLRQLGYVR